MIPILSRKGTIFSTNPRSLHRRAAGVHPFFLSNHHVAHGVRHRSHFITARRR